MKTTKCNSRIDAGFCERWIPLCMGLALWSSVCLAGSISRGSVASGGGQANRSSEYYFAINGDGRFVVFCSQATNLMQDDKNERGDIFVHECKANLTTCVSLSSNGEQGKGESSVVAISKDGRFVVFSSGASNLDPSVGAWGTALYLHDLETKQTSCVSISPNGQPANADCYSPSISGDGKFISFYSRASNLVPGDTNGLGDIFRYDRQTKQIIRVNVSSTGQQARGRSRYASAISVDGRLVAFASDADNLVEGDTNDSSDIFVHDCKTGQTTRVSASSTGQQSDRESTSVAISGDGRFVAFRSAAGNLVENDTNGCPDIFVHDRQTEQTTRVSLASSGEQANRSSAYPSISGNGRWVSFSSQATNLVPGITNAVRNIFVRDCQTKKTACVSVSASAGPANANCLGSRISADGRFVAFSSSASNLVTNDTNHCADIFVRDREGD